MKGQLTTIKLKNRNTSEYENPDEKWGERAVDPTGTGTCEYCYYAALHQEVLEPSGG